MQLQKIFALSILALLGNVVGTLADLESGEVPKQCKQVCDSVVQRSQKCDNDTHDDHSEKECVCKLKDASTVVPQCEACVAKYHSEVSNHSDPRDNDVYDIIQFCQFTTTSYNGGGTPATSTSSMASATGSPATGSGTSAVGTMPSVLTAAPFRPVTSGSGSASASASSSMPVFTGGASVMDTGRNALEAMGATFAFACAAALI